MVIEVIFTDKGVDHSIFGVFETIQTFNKTRLYFLHVLIRLWVMGYFLGYG